MFRKEKNTFEDDPKKSWIGIEVEGEVEKEEKVRLEVSWVGIQHKKGAHGKRQRSKKIIDEK